MYITSIFKFGIPLVIASSRVEYEADTDTYTEDVDLYDWLETQDLSETLMRWFEISSALTTIYLPMTLLFGLFLGLGVGVSPLIFWIEHILSNLNWVVYLTGMVVLYEAALIDRNAYGWWSVAGYFLFAFFSLRNDYFFGTQAIRYLDNEYYSDPYLVPSALYLFGLRSHKESEIKKTESDPTHVDDTPIDNFLVNV